jgi:hypothetical protein
MGMRVVRVVNGLVLVAAAGLFAASGSVHEHPVLTSVGDATSAARIGALEAQVAAAPGDDCSVRALAQAYLDAQAPGMALAVIERAPLNVRTLAKVEHLQSRALIEEGRARDALAVEREVLETCTIADGVCDSWLFASARRRADILEELAAVGVEDARAEPEASAVAYRNATRDVRIAVR